VLLLAACASALLAVSLWWTAPAVLVRATHRDLDHRAARELAAARAADRRARRLAEDLVERERTWGERLSKIALLYGISPSRWPRVLDPGRGLLAAQDPERLTEGMDAYLAGLERARALIAGAETENPDLASRTPSILPVPAAVSEPAAFFGPRTSPWTGQEEFFCGLDLAAPEGTPILAPADGRVIFTGRARRESAPRLWQFGSLVVLAHGPEAATLFGHLSRIEVRRGDLVRRGQRLGTVGKSGWAVSPRLHYELWTPQEGAWRPTDPLFAVLDQRLDDRQRSLEQMLATSAPEPVDRLPGVR